MLEAARESIGAHPGLSASDPQADRVIFTSGGTEANNLAVLGLAGRPPGRIIISSIEHPSVSAPAEHCGVLASTCSACRFRTRASWPSIDCANC